MSTTTPDTPPARPSRHHRERRGGVPVTAWTPTPVQPGGGRHRAGLLERLARAATTATGAGR